MRTIPLVLASVIALTASADPSITLLRAQQRYPWNGLVDLDYTVAGVTGDWADYAVRFSVTGETNDVAFAVSPMHFLTAAADDLPSSNGTFRVTWDSAADGAELFVGLATITASLVYAPLTDRDAGYMVIDISEGNGDGATYPVRNVRAAVPPSAFNLDVYKTTKLVLKRVAKTEGFWMGNSDTAGDVSSGSKRFRVALTDDFFLGLFPLTYRQYNLLTGKTGTYQSTGYTTDTVMGMLSGLNWTTAKESSGIFSGLNGRVRYHGYSMTGFSLPTEAQHQYACRAGSEYAYYWGTNDSALAGDYMWHSNNSDSKTHAVGQKKPNDWGFYDMLGNASEWTQDYEMTKPSYSETIITTNWVGTSGTYVVSRGGSFSVTAPSCAHRFSNRTPGASDTNGAREGGVRICRLVP